jgi:hypothetical protein
LRRPGRSRGGARGDPAIGAGGQVGVPLNAASSLRGDDHEWPEQGEAVRERARAKRAQNSSYYYLLRIAAPRTVVLDWTNPEHLSTCKLNAGVFVQSQALVRIRSAGT